jgi:tetratricopeptide (TPR) repeat protein
MHKRKIVMRRGIPRALAWGLLATTFAIAGCQSSAKKHLYKAEDMFEKRDLKGAQVELREAVKEDPNLTDAHNSLARVDEYLKDYDEAGKEFMIASQQDPGNQKTMAKARYYRYLQQITQQGDKALDEVKSGDSENGMKDLKAALQETKTSESRAHIVDNLRQAIPVVVQQAEEKSQQKQYAESVTIYQRAIQGYMYIAEATQKPMDKSADAVMHKANEAAKAAGTPDMMFKILNDVMIADPDNKTANIELAQVYIRRKPPDYSTAADLMERAGASDSEVKKLRAQAKRHH